ncbi:MAG: RluA family pseudouridine synthase [Bacteroidales bacterium]|nr:RluA family pseudouridine synthase [Candidatus Colimorpha merdihippi]
MLADQILYEDNHLIAINKLAGQIVQGDKTGDVPLVDLLKEFIKERDHKPGNVFCGTIHRLDRPVSGVVVFAKTSKALSRMNELVKGRDFHKTYHAVVKDMPPQMQGHLEDYLVRNEKLNKSFVTRNGSQPGAKLASLDYHLLATSSGGYHLLEIELHTGRHHQIRCQLAHMGCPIKGDLKYGAPRSNPDASISLHSYKLTFEHPVKHESVTIIAPDPWSGMFE